MSAKTLPGTIPGLIRRCSPVIRISSGGRSVVSKITGPHAAAICGESCDQAAPDHDLALDLEDPTGQAHAARWLDERGVSAFILGTHKRVAYERASAGMALSDYQIQSLRTLVLEMAEVDDG